MIGIRTRTESIADNHSFPWALWDNPLPGSQKNMEVKWRSVRLQCRLKVGEDNIPFFIAGTLTVEKYVENVRSGKP